MRRLLTQEGGFAVVTAVILMGFMLSSGVVLSQLVDAQTKGSAEQRQRETAMNVGEVALNGQAFLVGQQWPDAAAKAYPTCTTATAAAAGVQRCPAAVQVAGSAPTPDAAGMVWSTQVIDNIAPCAAAPCDMDLAPQSFYSDATHAGAPAWDANRDGAVWVRGEATAQGRTRRMVVMLRRQFVQEDLFRAPLLANSVVFTNNGNNKAFIQTGAQGVVYLRCTVESAGAAPCLGKGKSGNQTVQDVRDEFATHVDDPRWQEGYALPKAMAPEALERIRQTAIALDRYYTSCDQLTTLAGPVTWLEGPITCKFTGSGAYNSAAEPGFLVVNGGRIELRGNMQFFGPVYAPNPLNLTYVPVDFSGNATIHGGILADGNASVVLGSAGANPFAALNFDESAFSGVRSLSSAAMVQGSWRELPPPTATAATG